MTPGKFHAMEYCIVFLDTQKALEPCCFIFFSRFFYYIVTLYSLLIPYSHIN